MKRCSWVLPLVMFLACAFTLRAQQPPEKPPEAPPTPQAAPATPTTPVTPAVTAPTGEKVIVYVYRSKRYAGSALEPSVYVDDKEVARMDNGRCFAIKLTPGPHSIRSNDKASGVEMPFEAGQKYFVRVDLITGFWKGHGGITLVANGQAEYEIRKTKALGADKVRDHEMVSIEGLPPGGELKPGTKPEAKP
jgi:Protein of unknown function (DUF2846)